MASNMNGNRRVHDSSSAIHVFGLLVQAEIGHIRDDDSAVGGGRDVDFVGPGSQAENRARAAAQPFDDLARDCRGYHEECVAIAGRRHDFIDRPPFDGIQVCTASASCAPSAGSTG